MEEATERGLISCFFFMEFRPKYFGQKPSMEMFLAGFANASVPQSSPPPCLRRILALIICRVVGEHL